MKFIALIVLCLFTTGCFPMLVGAVGYSVSSSKKSSAELLKSYDEYKLGMEKLNIEREKNSLEPKSILTYEEWWNQREEANKPQEENK